MKKILSQEQKKYLRRICRYLGSLGMDEGTIEIDLGDNGEFNPSTIDWNYITHFVNNFSAEIPAELTEILKLFCNYIYKNDLIEEITLDSGTLNYDRLEIKIDCDDKSISFSRDYGYYDVGDTYGTTHEADDDDKVEQIFNQLINDNLISDGEVLTLRYNGSGDSGFVDGTFDNNKDVPSYLKNWCYEILEANYGGWEINEGSDGSFELDMDNRIIHHYHSYNEEKNEYDTILEEHF